MKKPYLLFVLFLLVAASSCRKKDDATPAYDFHVNGITDITLSPYTSGSYPIQSLTVKHVSGDQQNVTLSLLGLPAGITGTFEYTSGIPTFNTQVAYEANDSVLPGKYPVKLHVASETGVTKDFSFNITIPDFLDIYTGTYTVRDCSGNVYTIIITKGTTAYTLVINNFLGTGAQLTVSVIPGSNYMSIPTQTINGVTYQGSYSGGSSTGSDGKITSFELEYEYTSSTNPYGGQSCSIDCTRTN